jgi:hypothetical protein
MKYFKGNILSFGELLDPEGDSVVTQNRLCINGVGKHWG